MKTKSLDGERAHHSEGAKHLAFMASGKEQGLEGQRSTVGWVREKLLGIYVLE